MDKKRAKEISRSPEMMDVTYNGQSIYIESVNEKRGTASVYPLNQPQKKQDVNLTELIEN